MASKYKTFTLEELEGIICRSALESMKEPAIREGATVENELVAIYNDAVGTFAGILVGILRRDDDEE